MKLNLFNYSISGHYDDPTQGWILITTASEEEVKQAMREYAETECKDGDYSHRDFMEQFEPGLLLYFGDTCCEDSSSGELEGVNIDLNEISEEELYSEESWSHIIHRREEERKAKYKKQAQERAAATERHERMTMERLMKKYPT